MSAVMSAVMAPQDKQFYRWVSFNLGTEVYGVNVMQVQEVLRLTEIAPVPGAPPAVVGIINLRGNVVTVIDTRRLFGIPANALTENARIMIVECNKITIGFLVDSVAEVVNIDSSEIDAAPNIGNDDNSRYIQGVYNREGEILILVDLNKLVSADGQIFEPTS
jgi:purine-binding chemotaxis protein CheW